MKNSYKLSSLYLLMIISFALVLIFVSSCDTRNPDPNKIKITSFTILGNNHILVNDGVTTLELEAKVDDEDGFGVENQIVRFRGEPSDIQIVGQATTDSTGTARVRATYRAGAPIGNGKATITASLGKDNEKSVTVDLMDAEAIRVESIEFLNTVPTVIEVTRVLQIRVKPIPEQGHIIPEGIGVTFSTDGNKGAFFNLSTPNNESPQLTIKLDEHGVALVGWRAGIDAGATRIFASVANREDSRPIMINPGQPRNIEMNPPANTIVANSPGFVIPTYLFDSFQNPIPNKAIEFATTRGSITPSALTDEFGIAYPHFTPGAVTEAARVTATCGDSASTFTDIAITSDGVAQILFSYDGPIDLQVFGGVNTALVGVKALDSSSNEYQPPVMIRFELIDEPGGVKIEGSSTYVDVPTANGEAKVVVVAGTKSGAVILRATLLNDKDEKTWIYCERANIIIHSGEPHFASILSPYYDSAVQYDAATWRVSVGVLIQDIYRNPIAKGTGVHFSINNNYPGWTPIDELPLSIEPVGYVGNVSALGDSLEGVAYTSMIYHGTLSNFDVPIKIDIGGGFTRTLEIRLPMNQVSIEVAFEPGYALWNTMGMQTVPAIEHPSQLRFITLIVTVRDGMQNPMRNAMLHFMEDDGFFMDQHSPDYYWQLHGPTTAPNNGVGSGYPAPFTPPWNPPAPASPGYPENPTDYDFNLDPVNGFISTPNRAPTNEHGIQEKKWYSYRFLTAGPVPPAEAAANIRIQVAGADTQVQVQIPMRWWFD